MRAQVVSARTGDTDTLREVPEPVLAEREGDEEEVIRRGQFRLTVRFYGGFMDSIFKPADSMVRPRVKLSLDGFPGSGKSHTATECAIGIFKAWKVKGPMFIVDNEKASKFLIPMLASHKIKAEVVETDSIDVVLKAIREVESKDGLLLIDSVTNVHSRLVRDHLGSLKNPRKTLEIQDRPLINEAWTTQFEQPFVNANCHIIFTGRAATDWGNGEEIDERTGKVKRTFFAKGVKMAGAKDTLYAPDFAIYMERQEVLEGKDKKVWREATIIKDRSRILDGKTFRNPTYADLGSMFEFLLSMPEGVPNVVEGDPRNVFGEDENRQAFFKRRDVALETLEGMLTSALPGQTAKEKKARVDCVYSAYGTASKTKIEGMTPEQIEEGLPRVRAWLESLVEEQKKDVA